MALSSDPARSEIADEFGLNTGVTAGGANESLNGLHDHIFGSGTAHERKKFAGYGRPGITSITYTKQNDNEVVVQFTLARNNLDAEIRLEYHVDDPNPAFTSQTILNTGFNTYTTDGVKQITITGLNYETDYQFRLRYYNLFTNDPGDWEDDGNTLISIGIPTLTTPSNLVVNPSALAYEWDLEWDSGSVATSYVFRWRINNIDLSAESVLSFKSGSDVNWGVATNPKEGIAQQDVLTDLNQGDTIYFQVRGSQSGYNSNWSGVAGYTEPYIIPTATTSAATLVDTDSARLNGSVGNVSGNGYTCEYYFQWRESGAGTWDTTTIQTTGSDGSVQADISNLNDDTQYEFRLVAWNQGDSTNKQYGSTVIFTTDPASLEPQNFAAVDNFFQHDLSWTDPPAGNPTTDYEIQWWDGSNWNILDNDVSATANTYVSNQTTATKYQIRSNFGGTYSAWVEATV